MKRTEKIFYGWIIVAVAWVAYVTQASIISYSGGVVTTHLILERNWNESMVGYANTSMYIAMAIFSVLAGMMTRKLGCRKTYLISGTLGAAGFFLVYLTDAPIILYLFLYFLGGVSTSLGGVVTAPIMVDNWFARRKAFPMAVAMTAGGIGGFILPPVTEAIYELVGGRGCFLFQGTAILLTLIPVVLLCKDHPEEIGEIKDGRAWVLVHPAEETKTVEKSERTAENTSLQAKYGSREFWLVTILSLIFRIAQTTFIAYALIHMVRNDIPTSTGVAIVAAANITSLVGRFLVSLTGRYKIPLKTWTIGCFILLTIGMTISAIGGSTFLFLISGCLIGFTTGFLTSLAPLLLSEHCGSVYFNEQFGMLNTICFTCMIVSPLLVSASAKMYNGYGMAFFVLGVLCFVCIGLTALLRIKKY